MKKKIFIIAFTAFFILFAYKAKAATFTDNQVVPDDKIWTIRFNDAVGLDSSTRSDINVIDSNGSKVELSIVPGKDNNSIQIKPAAGKYKAGEKYILNIGTRVHSLKNKSINNKILMHFSIQGNAVNYKVGDNIIVPGTSEQGKIIDLKQVDLDGDSKKEDIVLAGCSPYEGGWYFKNAYLMIMNPENGECKDYKEINQLTATGRNLTALYLEDYEGKGSPDIRINIDDGGNYLHEVDKIFSYKSGKLSELQLPEIKYYDYLPCKCQLVTNDSLKMTIPFDSKSYAIDLSKDEAWLQYLKTSGTPKISDLYVGDGPTYEDAKEIDGSQTLKMTFCISGGYHFNTVATIITTYEYSKQQQKFIEINTEVKSSYPCYQIISEGEATLVDGH